MWLSPDFLQQSYFYNKKYNFQFSISHFQFKKTPLGKTAKRSVIFINKFSNQRNKEIIFFRYFFSR